MKKFLVFNADDDYIGYVVLDDQMYFPYTAKDHFLGKGFFEQSHAVSYLQEKLPEKPTPTVKSLSDAEHV